MVENTRIPETDGQETDRPGVRLKSLFGDGGFDSIAAGHGNPGLAHFASNTRDNVGRGESAATRGRDRLGTGVFPGFPRGYLILLEGKQGTEAAIAQVVAATGYTESEVSRMIHEANDLVGRFPPAEIAEGVDISLAEFVFSQFERMEVNGKTFLINVHGISEGWCEFAHQLKERTEWTILF